MSLVLNVLTLGMLPLWRMLNGTGLEDPRREAYVQFDFARIGNPSEKKLLKLLKKYYGDADEAAAAIVRAQQGKEIFVRSHSDAEPLIEKVRDAGFKFNRVYNGELDDPVYWRGDGYSYVAHVAKCNSCGSQPTRLYYNWDDEEDCRVPSCSKCSSADVIDPTDLSLKEFLKHVEKSKRGSTPQRKHAA